MTSASIDESSPALIAHALRAGRALTAAQTTAATETITNALALLRGDFRLSELRKLSPEIIFLLCAYLETNKGLDARLEHLLTALRRSLLLETAGSGKVDNFGLDLLSALAMFCFAKEYVFLPTAEETVALKQLSLYAGPPAVAAMACYQPLYKLHQPDWLLDTEMPTPAYAQLLRMQLAEPLEEKRLAADIQRLGPITETVSVRVRQMYEENPFPRWTALPVDDGVRNHQPLKVLIAGCGSGQQPLVFARAYPEATVMAMDLSLASLAYGKRKAEELGISNITFVHGDILDLRSSDLRFDFISCMGVLHHMRVPDDGLRALAHVLAPGGTMDLALYSEIGRQVLLPAMKMRENLGLPATPEGIREFRRIVFSSADPDIRKAASFGSFYTMSGCRDTFFHVQEHRYTLEGIDALVKGAGLIFHELSVTNRMKAKFAEHLPDADPAKLLDWARFEALYPSAFLYMYSFSVSKPQAR